MKGRARASAAAALEREERALWDAAASRALGAIIAATADVEQGTGAAEASAVRFADALLRLRRVRFQL